MGSASRATARLHQCQQPKPQQQRQQQWQPQQLLRHMKLQGHQEKVRLQVLQPQKLLQPRQRWQVQGSTRQAWQRCCGAHHGAGA
jgi:hypothetical protein